MKLATLYQIAKDKHSTLARVVLAWLIARPGDTVPIASADRLQLPDRIQATKLELDQSAIEALNAWAGPTRLGGQGGAE
jgi:aryl-alcohol dehydrogenase-like predicted oxidoreductase